MFKPLTLGLANSIVISFSTSITKRQGFQKNTEYIRFKTNFPMTKFGPILVIEDDFEDRELLEETFKTLNYPNKILFFEDGFQALAYIESTDVKPFLILSDVNMPTINGFELRKKIYNNAELSVRCIPYLFFTSGTNKQAVQDAYAMSAQGFFIKPSSMQSLENTIRKIVEYWQECYAPNQYAD